MRAGLTGGRAEPIDIALCLDEALLLPAAVLLSSIAEHADVRRPVRAHVLTTFPVEKLLAVAPRDGDALRIDAREVDNCFSDLPRNDYISQGTYLRFLLPELLPDIARLIYLDVDMIVHRSLVPLADLDLGGLALAAASDVALALGSTRWDWFDLPYEGRAWSFADYRREVLELGGAPDDSYFNAGLLVIDLDHWRREGIARRTLDFLARKPALKFMDQDALSHAMQGRYLRLDPRWNAVASCADAADGRLRTRLSADGRRWERARALWRDDPWIVNFAGPRKPWAAERPVAHADLWWSYARRSPAWPLLEPDEARYRAMCQRVMDAERSWLARALGKLRIV